jgi:hypothetical protein
MKQSAHLASMEEIRSVDTILIGKHPEKRIWKLRLKL